jgi:hypothetical protein
LSSILPQEAEVELLPYSMDDFMTFLEQFKFNPNAMDEVEAPNPCSALPSLKESTSKAIAIGGAEYTLLVVEWEPGFDWIADDSAYNQWKLRNAELPTPGLSHASTPASEYSGKSSDQGYFPNMTGYTWGAELLDNISGMASTPFSEVSPVHSFPGVVAPAPAQKHESVPTSTGIQLRVVPEMPQQTLGIIVVGDDLSWMVGSAPSPQLSLEPWQCHQGLGPATMQSQVQQLLPPIFQDNCKTSLEELFPGLDSDLLGLGPTTLHFA